MWNYLQVYTFLGTFVVNLFLYSQGNIRKSYGGRGVSPGGERLKRMVSNLNG